MSVSPSWNYRLWGGLFLMHLSLPVGLWATVKIGRPRFVGLALYIVLAVAFTDVLLVIERWGRRRDAQVMKTIADPRVVATILLMSITILAVLGASVPFYASTTVVLVTLLLRALVPGVEVRNRRFDLAMLCVTAASVLAAESLTVAYYVNAADTVNHVSTAMVLTRTGNLMSISSTRYFAFPAFHVLSSAGIQFTGLAPRLAVGILMIVLFQLALLALYCFFDRWSTMGSVAFIATVLVSVNIAYLRYGALAHYQSMSFVLFCVFLFLLFRGTWGSREVVVVLPIVVTWTITHHVSVVMAIVLMGAPVCYVALRAWRSERTTTDVTVVYMFATFCLTFGAYWAILTTKFREIIVWVFFTSAAAEGLTGRFYLVRSYETIEQLVSYSIPFFVDSVHYSALLALTGVGVWVLLTPGLLEQDHRRTILVGAVPAALLYFPSPAWIPLEGLAELNRWRLMVLPLFMIVPAIGFRYGVRSITSTRFRTGVIVLFSGLLVFIMLTSGLSHPGLTDIAGINKAPQEELTDQELAATEFVFSYADTTQQIYARSDLRVYLRQYAWATDRPFQEKAFARISTHYEQRKVVVKPGLTVFSIAVFEDEGFKSNLVGVEPTGTGNVGLTTTVSSEGYHWDRQATDIIYSNGEVVIQHK